MQLNLELREISGILSIRHLIYSGATYLTDTPKSHHTFLKGIYLMSEYDTVRGDQLLSLLAQQSKEHAFILLDADARVVWWSPGAEYIFDRSSSEMVGQPLANSVYSGR